MYPDVAMLHAHRSDERSPVRGYGDTHERGWHNYQRILAAARTLAGRPDAAATVDRLRRAAAQDERGTALERELTALDTARAA